MHQPPAPTYAWAPPAPPRKRPVFDLMVLGVVGVLLAGALWAGFSALNREFWGPSAFVERYLATLADGDAAAALAIPGVALDTSDLEDAGLPVSASDALLRRAMLTFSVTDVSIVDEHDAGDEVTEVTAAYALDGTAGQTTFRVRRTGTEGLVPRWAFDTSPLAEIQVGLRGSRQFTVNGFEIDQRQVSPDGADADPLDRVSMLVFTPGLYAVGVDTATSEAKPVTVFADAVLHSVPLDIQTAPTRAFSEVVTDKVDSFLSACATQQVLQPTGCPFGIQIDDRVQADTMKWTITTEPHVEIVPDGAFWAISAATGTAHLEADVVSIFDGSVYHFSEEVPFVIDGTVELLPDGTASILVGSPTLR